MKKNGLIIGLLVLVGVLVAGYFFLNKNLPPIFEQLIKGVSQVFSGVSTYQLLADIFIPVVLFVLGVIFENKYQIVNKVTQKINLGIKQSGNGNIQNATNQKSGRDSVNSQFTSTIESQVIGIQNITYGPPPMNPKVASPQDALQPPDSLDDPTYVGTNIDYIIKCFEKHSKKIKPPDSFKEDLINAHRDLSTYKNADVSASSYFNVFKNVIDNLTNRQVFCDRDKVVVALAEVKISFNKLAAFVSKKNKPLTELTSLIDNFERNVVWLLAYI